VVLLLSQTILASPSSGAKSSTTIDTDHRSPAARITPEADVAEVQLSSSADELASIERAREQITSLVRADDPLDWSALTSDLTVSDEELVPTSLEDFDAIVLAGVNPAVEDWVPLGSQVAQLVSADVTAGFAGVMMGGGSGAGGWSGGGGGVGSIGAGEGLAAGGDIDGPSISARSTGSREAFDARGSFIALGANHDGNHDVRGEQAARQNGGANNGNAYGPNENGNAYGRSENGRGEIGRARSGSDPARVVPGGNGVPAPVSVPEPSTLLLTAAGLGSLTMARLRRVRAGR
jgi:hypothetical protein